MLDFLALRVFVKATESGSLTGASKQLGVTVSGAARALNRLEDHLGVRLLNRSTRRLSLTQEGASFYEHAVVILTEINQAESNVARKDGSLRGRLVVDVPLMFARRYLLAGFSKFLADHPNLEVSLSFDADHYGIMQDGLDAVIRGGELTESNLVRRKLITPRYLACASPEYFRRYGKPETPEDLRKHTCLTRLRGPHHKHGAWQFQRDGKYFDMDIQGHFIATRGMVLVDMAILGNGIVYMYDYFLDEAIENGQLDTCLNDYVVPAPSVSLYYLASRNLSPKIRAFIDFAVDSIRVKSTVF
jgi:LysR family transcriptional regulator for bpeEF and oprC